MKIKLFLLALGVLFTLPIGFSELQVDNNKECLAPVIIQYGWEANVEIINYVQNADCTQVISDLKITVPDEIKTNIVDIYDICLIDETCWTDYLNNLKSGRLSPSEFVKRNEEYCG